MRILIINELYKMGGAEIQARKEYEMLSAYGHEVCYLTMDPDVEEKEDINAGHINIPIKKEKNRWKNSIRHLFFNKGLSDKVNNILEEFRPDVIHVNILLKSAVSVYPLLRKWKCVQTIRDFSAVCPRGLGVDIEDKPCAGFRCGKCLRKCGFHGSLKTRVSFLLKLTFFKKVIKMRKKNIFLYIAPSQCLTDYCNAHGLKTVCINNPKEDTDGHNILPVNYEERIFLLFGLIAKHKGVLQLLEAFEKAKCGNNVRLEIIGKVVPDFKEELDKALQRYTGIVYHGEMEHAEVIAYLQKVFAVIVPSVWLENYPNTALEAVAAHRLVLGSDRGGIPEIIVSKNCLFDVLSSQDIQEKLQYAAQIEQDEYEKITKENYKRFLDKNTYDLYYERLMDLFEHLVAY